LIDKRPLFKSDGADPAAFSIFEIHVEPVYGSEQRQHGKTNLEPQDNQKLKEQSLVVSK
jgi:hypothetical protein